MFKNYFSVFFISLHMLKWPQPYKVSLDIERWLTGTNEKEAREKTTKNNKKTTKFPWVFVYGITNILIAMIGHLSLSFPF